MSDEDEIEEYQYIQCSSVGGSSAGDSLIRRPLFDTNADLNLQSASSCTEIPSSQPSASNRSVMSTGSGRIDYNYSSSTKYQ